MRVIPEPGRRLTVDQIAAMGLSTEEVRALADALEGRADALIDASLARDPSGKVHVTFSVGDYAASDATNEAFPIGGMSAEELHAAGTLFGEKYAGLGKWEVEVTLSPEHTPRPGQIRWSLYVTLLEPQLYSSLKYKPHYTDHTFDLRFFPEEQRGGTIGGPP